ncbi:MAG TPA: sigma-70 family RNA polymerase sigma factor [Pyrinomonadaceae bacterium]|nr:sigma-70 family RNA polymerase sigma factor [Pyrinomonadaceae bacterium]
MSNSEIARNMFLFGPKTRTGEATVATEAHLVDRARAGDKEAFGDIYRMFAPLVHGIVLARVPSDDVQDIVQDVFLVAYNKLDTLREKNAIGAWLVRIARNQAAEFYRQSRMTEELPDDLTSKDNPDAEAREILAAIRELPETYRETLVLRLVEGMTGNEIAERTGLKPESVRVNLHRGMELLRQALGVGGRT